MCSTRSGVCSTRSGVCSTYVVSNVFLNHLQDIKDCNK